jgi:hypothetical protein
LFSFLFSKSRIALVSFRSVRGLMVFLPFLKFIIAGGLKEKFGELRHRDFQIIWVHDFVMKPLIAFPEFLQRPAIDLTA